MYSFPELIKQIRKESGVTQKDLAKILSVSPILISMIEVGQKKVSKNFIVKLANKLEVSPISITPFLFMEDKIKTVSGIEKELIILGEKLQDFLIKKKAKNLAKYVSK